MSGQMKPQFKLFLIAAIVGVGLFTVRFGMSKGWIPTPGILKSVVPQKAALPDIADAVVANVQPVAYPTQVLSGCQDPIRVEGWEWNSQIGLQYANGGLDTMKGTLMEKHNGCMHWTTQNDTNQMKNDLLACAKELSGSSTECSDGQQFIIIMGDGAGQFLAGINPQLKKLCGNCYGEIVGTTGFSRGEDALMGPDQWRKHPALALGDGLIIGVLRDGDWNIAMKWAADNNLKNNPDETTFDPEAINWVNTDDYIKAANMYVAGYCEDRRVVKDGKLTGETRHVCAKGIVTWTPGDVIAAEKKGGIIKIVSTKEYRSQMPSAIIGISKFDSAHGKQIASMLAATFEAGDQIKAFPTTVLPKAADIAAKMYADQGGAYWMKYYKGVEETDATGMRVSLGGSYADNLNDALNVFGLAPGSNNNFKATYTVFAKIDVQQYPNLFKDTPIPTWDKASNTSYILQAKSMIDDAGSAADTPEYSASSDTSDVVSRKNWNIEFATGSARLTPAGLATVSAIKDEVAITGLNIVLNGHTDNTGSAAQNDSLSQARADSVKQALQGMAANNFPDERFRVHGYGSSRPIADNSTNDGRAKNRRVEVILAE